MLAGETRKEVEAWGEECVSVVVGETNFFTTRLEKTDVISVVNIDPTSTIRMLLCTHLCTIAHAASILSIPRLLSPLLSYAPRMHTYPPLLNALYCSTSAWVPGWAARGRHGTPPLCRYGGRESESPLATSVRSPSEAGVAERNGSQVALAPCPCRCQGGEEALPLRGSHPESPWSRARGLRRAREAGVLCHGRLA